MWHNLRFSTHFQLPQFTFANLCRGHAALDFLLGFSILYSIDMAGTSFHGSAAAKELLQDDKEAEYNANKVTTRLTESASGLLMVDIGLLLSVISTSTSQEFQKLTCQCALGMHGLMIGWRLMYQRHVEVLRQDMLGQICTDVLFASTWGIYLYKMIKNENN